MQQLFENSVFAVSWFVASLVKMTYINSLGDTGEQAQL